MRCLQRGRPKPNCDGIPARAEGDFVTAIGEIALKDDEGRTTHYAYCDVWHFEDGKMAALRAYVVETHAAR